MRLSYEVENDRREIILESDDTDRSGDVNDWSVLFQWAADFEFGEGASEGDEEATMTTLFGDDKIISISPMEKLKSFKAGEVEATAKVVDYLRAAAEGRKMVAPLLVAATISALADDLANGLHIDPPQ